MKERITQEDFQVLADLASFLFSKRMRHLFEEIAEKASFRCSIHKNASPTTGNSVDGQRWLPDTITDVYYLLLGHSFKDLAFLYASTHPF